MEFINGLLSAEVYIIAMRILAIILGIVVLIGSFFTGVSYFIAWRGRAVATVDRDKAAFDLQLANGNAELEFTELQNSVDRDKESIEQDKADVILGCHLKACIDLFTSSLMKHQKALGEDTKKLEEAENLRLSGGVDSSVGLALEHLRACEESRKVWLAVLTRDQHFAYTLVGLWVAFGFAVALSRRG